VHLGHLVGALSNWATLQDRYDCFYFVADWHALTSDYADTTGVVESAFDKRRGLDGRGLDSGTLDDLRPVDGAGHARSCTCCCR